MKKTLCLLLALVMLLAMMPAAVAADDGSLLYNYLFPDGTQMDPRIVPLGWLYLEAGGTEFIKLYYGNADSQTALESGELTSSDSEVLAVMKMTDSDGGVYYKLECVAAGTATLTWTDRSLSYSQEMTVNEAPSYPVGMVMCDISNDKDNIDNYVLLDSIGSMPAGTNLNVYIAFCNGFELMDINEMIILEGTSVHIEALDDYYSITIVEDGTTVITFNGESVSQTIRITVGGSGVVPIPSVAFYSQRNMDPQYLIGNGLLNILDIGTTLWLMSAEGFTLDQVNTLSVTDTPASKTPTITPVLRDGSTDRYDIAVELVQPDAAGAVVGGYDLNFSGLYNGGFRVCVEAEGYQFQAGEYSVNFGSYDEVSDILTIHEPENMYQYNTQMAANPDNPYIFIGEYQVFAGTWQTDSQGITVYHLAEDLSLDIVSARIETLHGDEATFSFSRDSLVKSMGNGPDEAVPGEALSLYVKEGYTGYCRLVAYVNVMRSGESIAYGPVSLIYSAFRQDNISFDYEADLASGIFSGTITKYLEYIADHYIDEETYPIRNFTVTLGDKTYTEDVIIDARFSDNDNLTLVGGAATIIEGCINLNGTANQKIRNINLRADSDSYNEGIFGGRCIIDSCSFYNYDIALNDTEAYHSSVGNSVFINNEIAWNIESSGSLMNRHNYNTFINNTVALNVGCTHSENSSYYFRIIESNFINNGTDFNASTGGTLYMYRNYFGEYKKVKGNTILPGKYAEEKYNGEDYLRLAEMAACKNAQISSILSRRPAVITVDSDTTVIANPRWKYPIKDWWKINNKLIGSVIYPESNELVALSLSDEEEVILDENGEYVDILVTDWDNLTTIINNEANSLIIDASAFEEESESKVIEVVDSNEDTLGTWTFE